MDNTGSIAAQGDVVDEVVIVKVWDWPVRIVHWAMVVLLVVSLVTVSIGGNAMEWHMRSGESMLTLVIFRVIWGFVGSRHARFANFLRGPRAVLGYARSLVQPPHQWHSGHNPLGGWMVIALLVALLLQAGTGLFANDDIATDGPLVRFISKDLSDAITSYHRRNAWLVIGLAVVHIGAVLTYLFALKENLILPMLDGSKRAPVTIPRAATEDPYPVRALVLFAWCAFAVWWLVTRR